MKRAVIGIALIAAMVSGCTTVDGQSKPVALAATANHGALPADLAAIQNGIMAKTSDDVFACTSRQVSRLATTTKIPTEDLAVVIYYGCSAKFKLRYQAIQAVLYDQKNMFVPLEQIKSDLEDDDTTLIATMIIRARKAAGSRLEPDQAPSPPPAPAAPPSNERAA